MTRNKLKIGLTGELNTTRLHCSQTHRLNSQVSLTYESCNNEDDASSNHENCEKTWKEYVLPCLKPAHKENMEQAPYQSAKRLSSTNYQSSLLFNQARKRSPMKTVLNFNHFNDVKPPNGQKSSESLCATKGTFYR